MATHGSEVPDLGILEHVICFGYTRLRKSDLAFGIARMLSAQRVVSLRHASLEMKRKDVTELHSSPP